MNILSISQKTKVETFYLLGNHIFIASIYNRILYNLVVREIREKII